MALKSIEEIIHEEYPVMWKRERVGTFIEDCIEKGYFTFYMVLDKDKEAIWPPILKVRQNNGIVDNYNTIQFIKSRVTPPYQDGIEEKLAEMGMDYYDYYLIFRDGNGFKPGDFVWVQFKEELTFDNTHPRAWKV